MERRSCGFAEEPFRFEGRRSSFKALRLSQLASKNCRLGGSWGSFPEETEEVGRRRREEEKKKRTSVEAEMKEEDKEEAEEEAEEIQEEVPAPSECS